MAAGPAVYHADQVADGGGQLLGGVRVQLRDLLRVLATSFSGFRKLCCIYSAEFLGTTLDH